MPANDPIQRLYADALEVCIYERSADLARAAAAVARSHLELAVTRHGHAAVILASANSQIEFLEALVAPGGPDWSRITCFHMDEYLGIPADHPASFRRFLSEHVVQRVHPGQVHYLAGDCLEPLAECERYAALLAAQPIDLCCLGIGENGHIAFNDPPVADFGDRHRIKLVRLDEPCRQQQVGEGHYPNLAAVPQYAFTLTVPTLCAARRMVCVVPDARKAQAVHHALHGPISHACPASILRRQAHCTLFLDRPAASRL